MVRTSFALQCSWRGIQNQVIEMRENILLTHWSRLFFMFPNAIGICGVSRLSPRSIVAVLTFMTSAVITTTIVKPLTRMQQQQDNLQEAHTENSASSFLSNLLLIASVGAVVISSLVHQAPFVDATARAKAIPALVTGMLMAIGLFVSGMTYSSNIINFLNLALIQDGTWDASLMMVMASGILVSFLGYQIVNGYKVVNLGFNTKTLGHPILLGRRAKFSIPTNKTIDSHLVLGECVRFVPSTRHGGSSHWWQ
jgi:uncharacterized membrane protein YedE/YeeE